MQLNWLKNWLAEINKQLDGNHNNNNNIYKTRIDHFMFYYDRIYVLFYAETNIFGFCPNHAHTHIFS